MNLKDRNSLFCVYVHTSPSGKFYVGITSNKPETRWGKGGSGYYSNKHFRNAILKYGWENFKHDIVATDLTIEQASEEEKRLIALYNSSDPEFGYNGTEGGEVGYPSRETREKLRKSTTNLWKTSEFRNKVCSSLMGHTFSEESLRKMSETKRKRAAMYESPLKGIPRTEECKRKLSESMKGRKSWNKGLTKNDHEGIMRGSLLLSRPKTEEHKKNISTSLKKKFIEDGYSPIWINNGIYETLIDSSKTNIPDGFLRGRLDLDFVYVHRDDTDEEIRVPKNELKKYLQSGWVVGISKQRKSNIKKSRQRFYWIYEGVKYINSEELASYLRDNGYPSIVSSTITSLYNKGFGKSKMYNSLDGKITREVVHH